METQDKVRENRLRRWAIRLGYRVCKSRARLWHSNDHLLYQLVDPYRNTVVNGANFDLTLDDVEWYLTEAERKQQLEMSAARR
jgi:hypothetical protein